MKSRYTRQPKPLHVHNWHTEIVDRISFHVCDCGKKQAFDMGGGR